MGFRRSVCEMDIMEVIKKTNMFRHETKRYGQVSNNFEARGCNPLRFNRTDKRRVSEENVNYQVKLWILSPSRLISLSFVERSCDFYCHTKFLLLDVLFKFYSMLVVVDLLMVLIYIRSEGLHIGVKRAFLSV